MQNAARRRAVTGRIRSTHLWHLPWYGWLVPALFVGLALFSPFHPTFAAESGAARWWPVPAWLLVALLFVLVMVPLGVRIGERGIVAGKWFWFRTPVAFPLEAIDPASVRHWNDVGTIVRGLSLSHHRRTLSQPTAGRGITFVAPSPRPVRGREFQLWTLSQRDPARLLRSWADALDAAGVPGGEHLRRQAAQPTTLGPDPAALAQVPLPAHMAAAVRAPQRSA